MISTSARTEGRTERPSILSFVPRQRLDLRPDRHDIASGLPAALQGIVQKGLLERVFLDSLTPEWIFPGIADVTPWVGNIGDQKIWTRAGLLAPNPNPVTPGADASTGTYSVEQWTSSLQTYGFGVDTNMLASAVALASKYIQDVKTLGVHAGQSMNQAARNTLYSAYGGGRTWITVAANNTVQTVAAVDGLDVVSVNGALTAVSGSNPLTVTVNGVANTIVAVTPTTAPVAGNRASGPGTITLGSSVNSTAGWAIAAANAPASLRPTGSTANDLGSANIATLSLFRSAWARLKKMNVPEIGGGYTAFITADTLNELYSDPDFKIALTGQVESPVWRELAIGRINGIDFIVNNEVPRLLAGGVASGQPSVNVNRCIVVGEGALAWNPLENLGGLLNGTGIENVPSISLMSPATGVEVALIVRPPQDRFQNLVSTTWQTVGGFGVPTDLYDAAGDAALYKRGVVVEHA